MSHLLTFHIRCIKPQMAIVQVKATHKPQKIFRLEKSLIYAALRFTRQVF